MEVYPTTAVFSIKDPGTQERQERSERNTAETKELLTLKPRFLCACIAVASYFKYSCVFFSTSATDAVSPEFVDR